MKQGNGAREVFFALIHDKKEMFEVLKTLRVLLMSKPIKVCVGQAGELHAITSSLVCVMLLNFKLIENRVSFVEERILLPYSFPAVIVVM